MSLKGRQMPLDLLLVTIIVNSALCTETSNEGASPEFIRPIGNVTVPIGKEAVLTCAVSDLGNYRLGWVRLSDQTILSLHTHVVTPSSRFLTTYDNQNQWKLHIKGVTEKDIGCYMCQINTKVMKNQIGCLEVHVPPDIKEEGTSHDLVAKEGSNVTLSCNASGVPRPRVTWKREDSHTVALPSDFHVEDSVHSLNITRWREGRHTVAWQGDFHVGDSVHSLNITRRREGRHTVAWQNDFHVGDSVPSLNITRRREGGHTVAWQGDSYLGDSVHSLNITRRREGRHTVSSPGDSYLGDSVHSLNITRRREGRHTVSSAGDSYLGDSVHSLNITRRREGRHTVSSPGDSYLGDSVHSLNITRRREGRHTVSSPGDSYLGDSVHSLNITRRREGRHTVSSPGDSYLGDSVHSLNITRRREGRHTVSSPGDSYLGDSVPSLNITRRREGRHTVSTPGDSYVGDSVHSLNITRRREGGHSVAWQGDSYVGDSIHFVNISRRQSGNYLCIASNEVPPAVSKRIMLTVLFEPKLTVENEVVGALLGDVASLSCTAEMLPVTSVYWSKNDSKFGARHKIEDLRNSYIWQTKLTIANVSSEDFGFYHCTAHNEEERLTALVRLYQIIAPTTKPVPSTTTETTTIFTTVKSRTRTPRTTTTTEKAPLNYQVSVAVGVKAKQDDTSVSDPISGRHSDVTVISSKASIHHTVAQICLPGLFWLMSHDTPLL